MGMPRNREQSSSITVAGGIGCRRCFADSDTRIAHGKTREQLFIATMERTRSLREAGYHVIEK